LYFITHPPFNPPPFQREGEIDYIREAKPLFDSPYIIPLKGGGGIKKEGLTPLFDAP
jgi:hypothetical protein